MSANYKYRFRQVIFLLILFFTTILFVSVSIAGEKGPTGKTDSLEYSREKFSVSLGGFLTGLSTDILLGNDQLGLGIAINLEDALGLETSTVVLRGGVEYNFGKRHRSMVRFGYFGFFRSSNKVLESEIEIGDEVFPIGTEVNSRYDIQIFKTTYNYAYFTDERIRLGATIGLYVMPIGFSMESIYFTSTATDFIAPLPVLGFDFNFAVTPKIYLKQGIEVLYFQISDLKGTITDVIFRVEYTPWKHIGFGLGYNFYQLSLAQTDENDGLLDFVGSIKTGYSGLLFYGKFYF
jgi:hypothetical protein